MPLSPFWQQLANETSLTEKLKWQKEAGDKPSGYLSPFDHYRVFLVLALVVFPSFLTVLSFILFFLFLSYFTSSILFILLLFFFSLFSKVRYQITILLFPSDNSVCVFSPLWSIFFISCLYLLDIFAIAVICGSTVLSLTLFTFLICFLLPIIILAPHVPIFEGHTTNKCIIDEYRIRGRHC